MYAPHIASQRRFEDALRKLQADLDTKLAQRDEMKEQRRLQKEGGANGAPGSEGGDGDDADSKCQAAKVVATEESALKKPSPLSILALQEVHPLPRLSSKKTKTGSGTSNPRFVGLYALL